MTYFPAASHAVAAARHAIVAPVGRNGTEFADPTSVARPASSISSRRASIPESPFRVPVAGVGQLPFILAAAARSSDAPESFGRTSPSRSMASAMHSSSSASDICRYGKSGPTA